MLKTEFGKIGKFELSDVVGRTILCDDGVPRRVISIVHSFQHKDRFIINETDQDSKMGYFVHALSLSCQMLGKPLPTKEQKIAASRAWKSMLWDQQRYEPRMTPTGIVLPN